MKLTTRAGVVAPKSLTVRKDTAGRRRRADRAFRRSLHSIFGSFPALYKVPKSHRNVKYGEGWLVIVIGRAHAAKRRRGA